MSETGKLDVRVRYPEDGDKLDDHKVARDETVGSFKSRVLVAFDLKEGVDDKGELITFGLFHEQVALKDPETRKMLGRQGVEPSENLDVRAFLADQRDKFGRAVRELGITMGQ